MRTGMICVLLGLMVGSAHAATLTATCNQMQIKVDRQLKEGQLSFLSVTGTAFPAVPLDTIIDDGTSIKVSFGVARDFTLNTFIIHVDTAEIDLYSAHVVSGVQKQERYCTAMIQQTVTSVPEVPKK